MTCEPHRKMRTNGTFKVCIIIVHSLPLCCGHTAPVRTSMHPGSCSPCLCRVSSMELELKAILNPLCHSLKGSVPSDLQSCERNNYSNRSQAWYWREPYCFPHLQIASSVDVSQTTQRLARGQQAYPPGSSPGTKLQSIRHPRISLKLAKQYEKRSSSYAFSGRVY